MEPSEKMIKAAADAYWGAGVEHAPMALEHMRETLVAALAELPGEPVAKQSRYKLSDGSWSEWKEGHAILPFKLDTEKETRVLYAATPAPAVVVKALQWGVTSYGMPEVFSVVGVYRINEAWSGGLAVVFKNTVLVGSDGRSNFATVEQAKSAAQADFDLRIRSALEDSK